MVSLISVASMLCDSDDNDIDDATGGALKVDADFADGFNGATAMEDARARDMKSINPFLEVLAVAHSVMITESEDQYSVGLDSILFKVLVLLDLLTLGSIMSYEAESPDEYALVKAAASLGWKFSARKGPKLTVTYSEPGRSTPEEKVYEIVATNAFTSARKRMSVLVRETKGYSDTYSLFVKGADNVMKDRARGNWSRKLEEDLNEFSNQGLRTLVLGSRQLGQAEVNRFLEDYGKAQRATTNRDLELERVANDVEEGLKILGATAIEDKLQDGVPDTIQHIRDAGVKLWVLTGDKLETARNIGYSTKVLDSTLDIKILDPDGGLDLEKLQSHWGAPQDSSDEDTSDGEDRRWWHWSRSDGGEKDTRSDSQRALMVTGKAMSEIWESEELKDVFLHYSTSCAVLIACRVSPSQKAELVQFIRDRVKPTPVTLGIGDGANDVPMIQTAQVGIGIAGKEGRQAVNNSDFAIAQFRYLERLLLLHGRWNYRRACMFTLFTFWRNMVQVLMIVCYTFISGFSGTSIYEDWIRLTFNALCTIPILPPGCSDKDLPEREVLKRPHLYQVGPQSKDLNPGKTALTLLVALLHALVLLLVTVFAFPGLEAIGAGDYYTFGTICYTCLIIDVNYRATFLTHSCDVRWLTFKTAILSFIMYICWLAFYPCLKFVTELLTPNMYMVPEHMVSRNAYFFIMIFVIPLAVLVYDMFFHWFFHRCLRPDAADKVMRELEEKGKGTSDTCSSDPISPATARSSARESMCGCSADVESGTDSAEETRSLVPDCGSPSEVETSHACRWLLQQPYHLKVSFGGALGGLILLLCAALCHWKSEGYAQIRINYSDWNDSVRDRASFLEGIFLHYPVGTRKEEVFKVDLDKDCVPLLDGGKSCTITIALPYPLKQPMLFYSVGPMYQNYNHYMKSEVIQELYGDWDEDKEQGGLQHQREAKCPPRTREVVTSPGAKPLQLVPCGLKAMSFFNDTFEVKDYTIDKKGIAWRTDVDRYSNPGFNDMPWSPAKAERFNSKIQWLFQTFNGVIDPAKNVKDEDFVSWMRPSALPRVWNKVGFIHEDLQKGQNITFVIDSRWPVDSIPGGYKSLVLTEYGEYGTRHDGFARVLMCCSIVSLIMSVAVWVLKWSGCVEEGDAREGTACAATESD
ncbi:atp8b1 [Symbiodinium pilosum]|uniref:Phospholipid-transporting ATPase n=1 Tax=Symbiodinium pilosum TaxID=2952 RepID=A0A812WBQ7_SYMPI|nr:atp8b1 [Symbiodinium pilosum]